MGKSLIHRTVICIFILIYGGTEAFLQETDSLIYSSKEALSRDQYRAIVLDAKEQIIIAKPSSENSSITFSIYDSSLLIKKDEFSWAPKVRDSKYFNVISVAVFRGNILVISSDVNKKEKTETVWLDVLSPSGAQVSSIVVENRELTSMASDFSYELFTSDDEQFLGISSANENNRANQFEIRLYIYNESLVKLSNQSINLPNIKRVSFPSNFTLDPEGTVYFLNGLQNQKGDEVNDIGLNKRLYQLFRFNPTDEKLKQYDVSIADKYITDVKMKTDPEGNLVVLGFYNNSYEKSAEGLFTMVISREDGAIILSGKKPFKGEVLSDFKTGKQVKKNPIINNLFLDHFFFTEGGTMVLLAEVFNIEQRLMQDATGINMTTSTYYNFDEILALEIEQNLNYVRHHTIHKRQKSINFMNPYWSYAVLNPTAPENLKVLYNYVTPKGKKNAVTILSEARTSTWCQGVFSKNSQAIEADRNLKVAPLHAPKHLNNTLILQDKNEYRLAKILPDNASKD
ncbi:MAG: hypothetical protein AB8B53_00830 [Flavobacteriales bacterium]